MIGNRAKGVIIANTVKNRLQSRAMVFLEMKPLEKGQNPMTNKNYVLTDGMYYVKYNPLPDSVQWKGKPFVVISDMFVHKKIRVASWQGFWKVAQENPRARLIQKFTNISAEVFGLAKTHPGLQVPVCLDFVKYEKFLKENNPDLDYLHVFREVLEDDD